MYRDSKTKNRRTKMFIHERQNIDSLLLGFLGEDSVNRKKTFLTKLKKKVAAKKML